MPDPIDIHVGSRVRLRRTLLGMSQETLGNAIELTFQQVQKYERGTNRIGAGRLFRIASILEVEPSYFFDEMPDGISGYGRKGMSEENQVFEVDRSYTRRETLELVRAFYNIESEDLRQQLIILLRTIAVSAVNKEPALQE